MPKNKQDDIYEAAMQLFVERRYDGTTVPMIAEKAKIGSGTIYRYFESKEALVNSLFIKCILQLSSAITTDFPSHSSVRDQFHHIYYRLIEFAKHNVNAFLFINSHYDDYFLAENSKKKFKDFLDFIKKVIEDGQSKGLIRSLPSPALIAIVYEPIVMIIKQLESGKLEDTPELLQELEESSWNAIRII